MGDRITLFYTQLYLRTRKALEDSKPDNVEEIVLANDQGELLEGTQTNFFVVDKRDGAIVTANSGILEGTVRRLVIDECLQEGIPIRLEAPKLNEWDEWEAAFIASTSRFVLPINRIEYYGSVKEFEPNESITLQRIRELVHNNVYTRCEFV